jgi:hypothetical protein
MLNNISCGCEADKSSVADAANIGAAALIVDESATAQDCSEVSPRQFFTAFTTPALASA